MAKASQPDVERGLSLSTVPEIKTYLRSLGVSTRGLVIQRGLRNYAGPKCPGKAWNCTTSTKVVQLSAYGADDDDDGDNRFVCRRNRGSGTPVQDKTPPDQSCVIVQPSGSSNSATCEIETSASAGPISQTCLITQGGASNNAVARLEAVLRGQGTEQDILQRIEIKQTGGGSGNTLNATEIARLGGGGGGDDDDDGDDDGDDDDDNGGGGANGADFVAKQDFHQVICGNQQAAGSGRNTARVTQQGRALVDVRNAGDVEVLQNTESLASTCLPEGPAAPYANLEGVNPPHNPTLCPIEADDFGFAKADANTCARVQQDSGSGQNSIVQRQTSRLEVEVDGADGVDISQGSLLGGIDSTQDQESTGVSTNADTQDADQLVSVEGEDSVDVTQIEDPRCCADGHQLGNAGNRWTLGQDLSQLARVDGVLVDPSFEGGSLQQTGANYGNCESSGNCVVTQRLTNNAGTETNACSAASCDIFIDCAAAGEGSEAGVCTTEDDIVLSNTATASSTTPDPNGENNSDTETTLVTAASPIPLSHPFRAGPNTITPTSLASDLAGAVAVDGSVVTGASFVTVPPSGTPNAVADSGTTLGGFPTAGGTYAILTSGDANLADDVGAFASVGVGGAAFRGNARDVTILQIDLNVPQGRNCLTLDFKFLSEEFPDFVGSNFNDAFIAELDTNDWTTSGSDIVAPSNFAFDKDGNVVSVNAAGAATMTDTEAAGTVYGGATETLSASTPITVGAHSLYLSIFDQGDSVLDSAVFVDGLVLGTTAEGGCQEGATVLSAAKAADTATSSAGGANGYTITISNPSNAALTLTSIFDVLPAGFSYTAGSTTGVTSANPTIAGQNLTWTGSFPVPANGSVSLSFDVVVSLTPGEYFNDAGGTTAAGSVSPTGPTASVTVTGAAASADLSVSMSDSPDPVSFGDELTYTIVVSNDGPNTAQGVTLIDTLPELLEFGSADTTQGSCTQVLAVSCSLGAIASGESATVTITVTP